MQIIVILLIFFSFGTVLANERTVSLDWEKVENVNHYEVEILNSEQKLIKRLRFKRNEFSLTLKVGPYKLRARSVDKRMVTGEWSDYVDFVVPPAEGHFVKAPQKPIVASQKNLKGEVPIEWVSAGVGALYTIEVVDAANNVVEKIETESTKHQFELKAGSYRLRLQSQLNGIASNESTEIAVEVLGAKMPKVPLLGLVASGSGFNLKWGEVVEGALFSGVLERQDVAAEDPLLWQAIYNFSNETKDNIRFPLELLPGVYRIKIAATAEGWQPSAEVIKKFLIKPKLRDLTSIDSEIESRYDFSQISK